MKSVPKRPWQFLTAISSLQLRFPTGLFSILACTALPEGGESSCWRWCSQWPDVGGGTLGCKTHFQTLLRPSFLLALWHSLSSYSIHYCRKGKHHEGKGTMYSHPWADCLCRCRPWAPSPPPPRPPATDKGSVSAPLSTGVLAHRPAVLSAIHHLAQPLWEPSQPPVLQGCHLLVSGGNHIVT